MFGIIRIHTYACCYSSTYNICVVCLLPFVFLTRSSCDGLGLSSEMACLLSAFHDKNVKLMKTCHEQLENRVRLWDAAVQVSPCFYCLTVVMLYLRCVLVKFG